MPAVWSSSHMRRIEMRILCLDFPRYVIIDERQRYWTGQGWSHSRRHALLYADSERLRTDIEKLQSR